MNLPIINLFDGLFPFAFITEAVFCRGYEVDLGNRHFCVSFTQDNLSAYIFEEKNGKAAFFGFVDRDGSFSFVDPFDSQAVDLITETIEYRGIGYMPHFFSVKTISASLPDLTDVSLSNFGLYFFFSSNGAELLCRTDDRFYIVNSADGCVNGVEEISRVEFATKLTGFV